MANKQRGSRVLYVAGSVRELPPEVQDWLGRSDVKAVASSNIYDAMAMLGLRRRPRVLIVSIEQVDWNELEFFDLAARSSPATRIYVTGPDTQRAKLDAAVTRGAHPFDVAAVEEDLHRTPLPTPAMSTQEVMDDTILSIRQKPSLPAAEPPQEQQESQPAITPPTQPVEREAGSAGTAAAEQKQEPTGSRPPVRLVSEPAAQEEAEESPSTEPIPFPWSPSPNRPKRIPPSAHTQRSEPARQAPPPPRSASRPPVPPVELTPDELAALVGKIAPPPAPKEQQS